MDYKITKKYSQTSQTLQKRNNFGKMYSYRNSSETLMSNYSKEPALDIKLNFINLSQVNHVTNLLDYRISKLKIMLIYSYVFFTLSGL